MKYCGGKKHFADPSQFNACKSNRDGLQDWCKHCMSEYNRDRHARVHVPKRRRRFHVEPLINQQRG